MWCKLFMIQTIRNAFFKSMAMTNYIANEDQKEMEPEEVCVKCVSHSVMSDSLQPHGLQPLSMELSGQEYWSRLPFPSPGDLPDPRIEPVSPALQADSSTEPQFTGWNASISLPRALAQFLMGKLKSHKLHSTVNKQTTKTIFLSHLV